MTGFTELLNRAEEIGLFRPQKVTYLRKELNLPKVGDSQKMLPLIER